jgi:hypothetical protein
MTEPTFDGTNAAFGYLLRAAQQGYSANRALSALREAGMGVRRGVGLEMYGQARRLAAEYGAEISRAQTDAPTAGEMAPWPTKGAEGVMQTVRLFYREQRTGRIVDRYYSVKSTYGVTRDIAKQQAIAAYTSAADRYRQTLVAAIHTGAARLIASLPGV